MGADQGGGNKKIASQAERVNKGGVVKDTYNTQRLRANNATGLGKGQEPIKRTKKPLRNAPCPCGSGQKYKKCCYGSRSTKSNLHDLEGRGTCPPDAAGEDG